MSLLTKRPCTADDDERYWRRRRTVIAREMEFEQLFLLGLRNEFGEADIRPLPVRQRKLQKANKALEKMERERPIFLWLLATVIGAAVAAVVIVVSVLT